jgi:hypothetical protein
MNNIVYNKEQIIISDGGIYKLIINQDKDRNTNKVVSYSINLGGKDRKCFNLRFPSRNVENTDGYLSWIEAHEECSFETFIEKGTAQHMILLGITIARDINPKLTKIYLDDISNITCELPNKEQKIPLKPFHIAFNEASWYEYYFDAKLVKDYDKYVQLKLNFYKSENKPSIFDFGNDDLQKELMPLYKESDNWHIFFEAIKNKYGKKKCAVTYPWINNALYIIFENNAYFENIKWYIDLEENRKKNKTHSVYFEAYKPKLNKTIKYSGGGKKRNKTLKKRKTPQTTNFITYIYLNKPDVLKWNYLKFLKS